MSDLSGVSNVAAVLRRAILDRAIPPGCRLPETTLGLHFQLSRTAVRAALWQLRADRLVELMPNRGARVVLPGLRDIEEARSLRRVLEGEVIRLVLQQWCEASEASLLRHLAMRDFNGAPNEPASFHLLLAKLGGSNMLVQHLRDTIHRSSLHFGTDLTRPIEMKRHHEHIEMVESLRRSDLPGCLLVMEVHLAESHAIFVPPASDSAIDIINVLQDYKRRGAFSLDQIRM